jgi:hypothetical protein
MAVFRVDVLVNDPRPVFEWINKHVAKGSLVRAIAYKTVRGWYMKSVFKLQGDAESFHRRWHPDVEDHAVEPFAWPSRS